MRELMGLLSAQWMIVDVVGACTKGSTVSGSSVASRSLLTASDHLEIIYWMLTVRSQCCRCGLAKCRRWIGIDLWPNPDVGISLVIGLGIFAFIASILCSAAFLYNAKDVS
ncbi:hypothetical protein ACOSQ4_017970 [Xanthoceras sorbifolium]